MMYSRRFGVEQGLKDDGGEIAHVSYTQLTLPT